MGDGKGEKHQTHRKRRKGDENDDSKNGDDSMGTQKGMTFKPVSAKEKKEKDEPKAKTDKRKQKVEVAVPPKKDNILNRAKASQEKVDTDRAKSAQMEPPVKKVKEE